MARVLVVDDEESIRTTLGEFLGDAGYAVRVAGDAPAARELLAREDFDVVVSDTTPPRVTGIELLKTVRAVSPHVQVILMACEPTVEAASEALRAGAFDYRCKPIRKEAFLKTVANAALVKALHDENRRLEEENRRYQERLEHLVEERTAELQEASRRLVETFAELERKQQQILHQERLRALGEMASGIVHDFNNTITPILGYSELLLRDRSKLTDLEEVVEFLRIINAAAQDAAATVERLRAFYRPHEGDEELLLFEPRRAVEQAIRLTEPKWRRQPQSRGVTIRIRRELEQTALILGNECELREALTNLIFNAVDAMPGGGTLSLRTRSEPDQAVIEVADTGTGMAEDVRRRGLDPFFTTKGEDGTGLGLGLVVGTVQRHGGTLDIESVPGKGTTVRIRLPAGLEAPGAAPELPAVPAALPSLRILVVDDELGVRGLIERYLLADGHRVETGANGREGLDRLRTGKFDLVVTDRAMPEMNGDQMTRAIREMALEMPIVMITGTGSLMTDAGETPTEVDLVLCKPLRFVPFRNALAQVWAKYATGRKAPGVTS